MFGERKSIKDHTYAKTSQGLGNKNARLESDFYKNTLHIWICCDMFSNIVKCANMTSRDSYDISIWSIECVEVDNKLLNASQLCACLYLMIYWKPRYWYIFRLYVLELSTKKSHICAPCYSLPCIEHAQVAN